MHAPLARRVALLLALCATGAAGALRSPAMADDGAERQAWARGVVRRNGERRLEAPDFGAKRPWLNVSRPLTLRGDLAGKVVVLDFWCYCCINCLHILPDLAYLERKYDGRAFAVVGVHSAKFVNEKDADHVREAVVRDEIRHPVVVDDDFEIWNAYGAQGWPHFVVVSPTGHLLAAFGGEGHRDDLDAIVAAALERYGATPGVLDPKPLPIALERAARPAAELAYPGKLAADEASDRLWISDSNHHRVVETTLTGRFLRAFGDGEPGLVDGEAGAARFHRPQGLARHGASLFVADTENHALRRIDLGSGRVETIAGTGKQGTARDGTFPPREIDLSSPWDLAFVGDDLYVAMAGDHRVWKLDAATGRLGAFAGDGAERRTDATAPLEAAFAQPSGLATDGTSLFVADSESSSVRRIALPSGAVTTLAGANEDPADLFDFGLKDGTGFRAKFQHPLGVALAGGVLWVADTYNHALRTVDPASGAVTTAFGGGAPGAADDPARFAEPSGLATAGRRLFVADTNNHRVRVLDLETRTVTTLALAGVPIPTSAARAGGTRGAAGADAWPTLPGTARSTAPTASLRAGVPTSLRLRLDVPDGWHLTEGAPSALRVDGLERPVTTSVTALETVVALPALAKDAKPLRVRALFYVCRDGGSCRVRSIDVALPVAPSADGPAETTLVDVFAP